MAASSRRPSHQRIVAAVVGLLAGVLVAWPHPGLACDQSLSACRQLQQVQQQEGAAQRQLQQIDAARLDAQSRAGALAGLVSQLQSQVAAQQAAIAATRAAIDDLDRQIRFTQADLMRSQAHLTARQVLLQQRVRSLGQQGPTDYVEVLLTARSFTQLVDRAFLIRDVVGSEERLVGQVRRARNQVQDTERRLEGERARETALLAQQEAQEQQLDAELATQQQALSEEQQLLDQLRGQSAELQARVASLAAQAQDLSDRYRRQLAQVVGGSRPAASGGGSRSVGLLAPLFPYVPPGGFPDPFPFGQCTWWAAYNYPVTWGGNATDWYANARAQGVPTSSSPSVGAIVVWAAGGGYSVYGHVAIVIAVGAGGSFEVSEMNYRGLGIIDRRWVSTYDDIEGFIPYRG
jgi:peptidoglycan hydrolase CwlO-like protein